MPTGIPMRKKQTEAQTWLHAFMLLTACCGAMALLAFSMGMGWTCGALTVRAILGGG